MSPANRSQITPVVSSEADERAIREIVSKHHEWFIRENGGAPLEINDNEFDFSIAQQRLIFSCWTEKGSRMWRVSAWNWTGERLVLQASRRMGAAAATIELVPRASAKAIVASIAAARQARCEKLARIVANAMGVGDRVLRVATRTSNLLSNAGSVRAHPKDLHPEPDTQHPSLKIERAALSPGMRRDQPGRYARIILRLPHERVAVTAIVARSDARNVDSLFSSALLWFDRLRSSPRRPLINRLLIIVEHNILEAARQRHVLLRDSLRQRIDLFEIRGSSPTVREGAATNSDETWQQIEFVRSWERKYLWRKRLSRFPPVNSDELSERADEIFAERTDAIDAVASRHGQTLRYHGLPFARVRRVMDRDRIWFGIEGSRRRLLDEYHQQDWRKLFQDLETYRNANCRERRHWLYRAAGEAWLESILRRDISKLDPGLIVAPLHAQFRTSHGGPTGARPIDLLALRHDGRLAVIELKVSEDREHVFQGVDYWRRVEAHRRRGHISSAKLFGEREISDESPLVYLVAPALRFHPSFATLSRTIAPDIEIYRFDINEDWRGGVRVVRRERVNA
jgi:hypothetical protein